jgi:formylglycine-generating enzyme required for sulfatase activity
MNVYQGDFPHHDRGDDGWTGTCPVDTYPPNDFGVYQTTGNVWEWCSDWFSARTYRESPRVDPTGPPTGVARVMRGGSYLCHDRHCRRYRVDARSSKRSRLVEREPRLPGGG